MVLLCLRFRFKLFSFNDLDIWKLLSLLLFISYSIKSKGVISPEIIVLFFKFFLVILYRKKQKLKKIFVNLLFMCIHFAGFLATFIFLEILALF